MKNEIFRAYDVRGEYPKELNEKIVERIAIALGRRFKKGKVIIGHDGRLSSPALYNAVLRGEKKVRSLRTIGKVGLITTPMLTFLVNSQNAAGGIMVTASHNPKRINGLKMLGPKGVPISGLQIQKILNSQ